MTKIFELETDLFPCLVDMKFKGVRVDVEKAKQFGNELETERDQLMKDIHKETGIKVDIWASASIKKLLDQQKIKDLVVMQKILIKNFQEKNINVKVDEHKSLYEKGG